MDNYFQLLMENRLEEADRLRQNSIPKKLIKFYSLKSDEKSNKTKLKTLREDKIWFSSADQFNDPYEIKCMYIDERALSEHGFPKNITGAYQSLFDRIRHSVYIASFSENSIDSLPMWAYYANNSEGFCVEYDVLSPKAVYKVSYEPKRIPLASLISHHFDIFTKADLDEKELEFYEAVFIQQFFLKHSSWAHEKEYRMIYPVSLNGSKEKKGINVPVANLGLKTNRIIAGLNCSKEHVVLLNRISNSLFRKPAYKVIMSETDYLLPVPIN